MLSIPNVYVLRKKVFYRNKTSLNNFWYIK